MSKWLWAVIVLCLVPQNAGAQFVDGNKLLRWCESSSTSPERLTCVGYIQAVSDTLDQVSGAIGVAECIPGGTETGQLRDVVVMYLRANPVIRSKSASGLVIGALIAAWRCSDWRRPQT